MGMQVQSRKGLGPRRACAILLLRAASTIRASAASTPTDALVTTVAKALYDMLQAALSSNASTVIIDKNPSGDPWFVRPLHVTSSNQLLVFEEGAHIMAKRDEFHGLFDTLLTVNSIHNLTIEGRGAVLQMRRDDYAVPSRGTCPSCAPYAKAEWRMGIGLHNASLITSDSLLDPSAASTHYIW